MTGCMLAIAPVPVLLGFVTFMAVLAATHYVSLGSMAGGALFPVFILLIDGSESPYKIVFGVVVALVLVITHRKNIERLFKGTENKTYLFLRRRKKEE